MLKMNAAVRVSLQNAFTKLKEIIWINEQQRKKHGKKVG